MVLHFVRAIFMLAILALAFAVAKSQEVASELGAGRKMMFFMVVPLIIGLAVMLIDMIWHKKNLQAISGLFFGLLAGLVIGAVLGLVAYLVASIFAAEDSAITRLIQVLILSISAYLCVSFVLQTKDDFRFIVPYVEFAKQAKGPRSLLLDTSVIIDGRIGDIAETRILESQIIVPRFILAELHGIADSSERLRRNRGRRGLDVLNKLQKNDEIDLVIVEGTSPAVQAAPNVDTKLVVLAKEMGGRIMTNDYNLNKISQLRGVEVVNVNDLANALKTVALPGEFITVKIVKPGEEAGQGVGYLDDGTMVVVEQGRDHVGKVMSIVVTSMLQTSAGRMVFGRVEVAGPSGQKHRN